MCVQDILPGREEKGSLILEFPRRFLSVDVGRVEGLKFVPERNFKNATQLGNICLAHTSLGGRVQLGVRPSGVQIRRGA